MRKNVLVPVFVLAILMAVAGVFYVRRTHDTNVTSPAGTVPYDTPFGNATGTRDTPSFSTTTQGNASPTTVLSGMSLSFESIDTSAQQFDGQVIRAGDTDIPSKVTLLFREHGGERTFETLKYKPEMVKAIQQLDAEFTPALVGVSSPNGYVELADGRRLLVLEGCQAHNCVGTAYIIALNLATDEVYLLKETDSGVRVYGKPDVLILNTLAHFYTESD